MIHISGKANSNLSNVVEGDVQPNATDVRLDKVFLIKPTMFSIDETEKKHRLTHQLEPDLDGYWILDPGVYEVVMEGQVSIADNEAGWIITRSTLNRNGVFITSGLYDSNYTGVMAGALHVEGGPIRIKRGTRVGQFLLFNSEMLHKYNGSYGAKSEHDKKYR